MVDRCLMGRRREMDGNGFDDDIGLGVAASKIRLDEWIYSCQDKIMGWMVRGLNLACGVMRMELVGHHRVLLHESVEQSERIRR